MGLQKGYGIRNSIPKGASTRTRFRVKRYERKIHENIFKAKDFIEIESKLREAMERYDHLLG